MQIGQIHEGWIKAFLVTHQTNPPVFKHGIYQVELWRKLNLKNFQIHKFFWSEKKNLECHSKSSVHLRDFPDCLDWQVDLNNQLNSLSQSLLTREVLRGRQGIRVIRLEFTQNPPRNHLHRVSLSHDHDDDTIFKINSPRFFNLHHQNLFLRNFKY